MTKRLHGSCACPVPKRVHRERERIATDCLDCNKIQLVFVTDELTSPYGRPRAMSASKEVGAGLMNGNRSLVVALVLARQMDRRHKENVMASASANQLS